MFEIAAEGGRPVAAEIRDNLLEPFIAATSVAMAEMAGVEVVPRTVYQQTQRDAGDDLNAVIRLQFATEGSLVLGFPTTAAAAFARRILQGVTEELDDNLILDCVGEIANVIAGQAEAMLAGSPYQFTFSIPKTMAGPCPELQTALGQQRLVVTFASELGEFALRLILEH